MPQDQMQAAELLRSKRDKLNKLPPEVRTKVLGLFFNRTVLPKLKASGLSKEELGIAQDRWQKGIMGEKQEPLPKEFGQRKEATPGLDTMEAFGAGGMSSLYGMMANLLRTYRKLPGEGPSTTGVNQFLDQAVKDWEQKYSQYKQRAGELGSPKAAAAGGLTAGAALSIPAGEAGSSLIPGAVASKLPVIGSALKGAAGGATMAPLYTSDPQEIKRWAEIGGVGGAVLGKAADWIKGLKSSRAQRIATRTAKVVQKEEGPKATETLANDYDQMAQKKFGKNLADLSTQQQEELVNDVHQQKVAEKKGKGKTPKVPVTPPPGMEGKSPKELSDWRKAQYQKLRSLGFNTGRGTPIYEAVHSGKSADDIIGTMKAAGAMAQEEQPAVKKAVEGVAKTAPEVISPEPKPIETKPPEIDRKAGFLEKYGFTQGKKVGDSYVYQARKGDNLLEVTLDEGGTWGVKLRGPNFEEFVGEGEKNLRSTVLNLANKYGFRLGQKIPVGVSGIPEGQKKLLDRLSEVRAKISDTKVSPLAKDRLKKTEENIKKALGGDAEAERKLAESAKTAKRREVAGAGQTGQATGIEGGEKGAPGAVVPTTPEKTPTVELIDSLKGLNFPGQDTQKLYKSLEGMRKAHVSDATLSELADSAYRHLGNKLGIEDADEMPLEELYKRITSLGGDLPLAKDIAGRSELNLPETAKILGATVRESPYDPDKWEAYLHWYDTTHQYPAEKTTPYLFDTKAEAEAFVNKHLLETPKIPQRLIMSLPQDVVQRDPGVISRIQEFGDIVGHDLLVGASRLGGGSAGVNLGSVWHQALVRDLGPEVADRAYLKALQKQLGLNKEESNQLLTWAKEGKEVALIHDQATYETMVHEIAHTLAGKLGVPYDKTTPSAVIQALRKEVPDTQFPEQWISKTHEAYTEVLTQYFMRDYRMARGMSYLKPGDFCYELAEHLLHNPTNPVGKQLIGWALGTALAITGAYKEESSGRTSTDGTS